jgi:hypothetical protein
MRTGLPAPTTVFGSSDTQVLQYGALANEILEDMFDRGYWQELEQEALFVTVATESQGNIYTLAPNGLNYFTPMTIFDRTLRLPVYGPLNAQEWQALKALPTTGPLYKYRIRGDLLLFNPVPVAGHSCAIEYMSEWGVAVAGVPAKKWFTADTDTPYIDANVFLNGVRWRWKAEKGFDYAEDFRMYEEGLVNSLSRNATKPTVNISGSYPRAQPGIFIPAGSWNV